MGGLNNPLETMIIWIIMQHSRSLSTFTLDPFLTVINFIYKNCFYHQPFDSLSIYHKYYQTICKKWNISLDNINENIDIKYINQILLEMNKDFSVNVLT